jgi:hypothetical protein
LRHLIRTVDPEWKSASADSSFAIRTIQLDHFKNHFQFDRRAEWLNLQPRFLL